MHSKRQVLNPEEELELAPGMHLVVEMVRACTGICRRFILLFSKWMV